MDDKRQRILRAALEVFLRYGYRRVTMDDIAQEVGISRPALYLTFPGKEAIFRDVVEMGLDEILRAIEAGLPAQRTLEARLNHVFELWVVRSFETVERSPAAAELLSTHYDFAKDVFERAAQRLATTLAEIIRSAVVAPAALKPSAEVRARVMIAAAKGLKADAKSAQELGALIHDLVRIVVAGLPVETAGHAEPPQRRTRRAGRSRSTKP